MFYGVSNVFHSVHLGVHSYNTFQQANNEAAALQNHPDNTNNG
jgi:hypothetical protein